MILATMLLLIAALVLVVVGFILDRLAIRKIKSGMRTLYKRIKRLEANNETADDGIPHTQDDAEIQETSD